MMKTKIIAHRGASAYAPENTLPAFAKALEMGSDGLELDVHMSKDGHLVVIHDERVDRTSNGKGFIKDLTLSELKALDFGGWFAPEFTATPIPTLEEVMELIKDWKGMLNIEIKSGPILYPGIEEKLIRLIKSYRYEDQVIFSSFNHYSLLQIKALDPGMKIGLLYGAALVEPWRYAQQLGAEALHPLYHSVIPELVQGCKANAVALHPWTIDDEASIERMCRLGVEGIITNKPDVAIRVRNACCE